MHTSTNAHAPTDTERSHGAPPTGAPQRHDFADIPAFLHGFRAMHLAMRRDAAGLARLAPQLTERRAARRVAHWFDHFVVSIEHHHQREDDVIWPRLIEHDHTFDSIGITLQHDHETLDRALHAVDVAIREVADGRTGETHRIVRAATELQRHLDDHLDREEAAVFPRLAQHFTADQYAVIEAELRRGLGLAAMAFQAPWVLDGLPAEQIAALLDPVPAPIRLLNATVFRPRYRRLTSLAFGGLR